ncbi:MAG: diguanylate cyclase [Oceanospirillaceae bacterium]|nr:diguanylate cyclase [Oceanospirillaceae bacterium]
MDVFWILLATCLVFVMQAGFLCLESGLVRSKNSINVAAKNLTDFVITCALFWLTGFGLMFGSSHNGVIGTTLFMFGSNASTDEIAVFLFQMMFCGTAATLVSGAVAERMAFAGYLIVAALITLFVYPVTGHWSWAGIVAGEASGWLEKIGFIDFAGSTVVHSVGGWVALAAIIVIGPRTGRFEHGAQRIPGSNLPMAVLGCLLLWFGWFGFNGGSTLSWNEQVPGILLNTCLAAAFGGIVTAAISYAVQRFMDVQYVINGVIGGLVAITASCHAVTPPSAALIGVVAGVLVYWGKVVLEKLRVDDAIGVIPAHLVAGIWGTLAVALFGQAEILGTGLSFGQQLQSQFIGVVATGLYSFTAAFIILHVINRIYPLRVSPEAEIMGLNVAEHKVSTEVYDLLSAMQIQQQRADFSARVPVEPFTEVGQIAQQYNRVIERVDTEITLRDQAFDAFRESEYRNGAILNAAMDCIIVIDASGAILEFNPASEQCFGSNKQRMQGANFFTSYLPEQLHAKAFHSLEMGFTAGDGLVLKRTNVTPLNRANGEQFTAEVVITQTTDHTNPDKEYTLYIRDITQQIKLRDRLRFLAYNDVLTGLSNRNHFIDQLKRHITYYQKNPGNVVLMFIDLDRFKQINDTLGHKAGDDLLCEVAKRLSSVVRDQDLVGRWGGDEFVLMLSGDVNLEQAQRRARLLLDRAREPVMLSGKPISILCSIGIALSVNGETNADRLLQHADLAMYKAKQEGRNNFQVFSGEMAAEAQKQFQLEYAIPAAISENQFFLEYQPKLSCDSGRILSFEALLRWNHPETGRVMPDEFIPIIDGSNFIVEVGEWVIEETFRQLAQWRHNGTPLLPVAVNISGRHLHSPRLIPFIKTTVEKYGISADLLEIEIPESVLVDNSEASIGALTELKKLGVQLAIDDFGTGYSSLSCLKRFPIDVLKIDRAFVSECASNQEDGAICTAIIAVAKTIGLDTVAEGVEDNAQLNFLREHGCDTYQGWLFSPAVAADDAEKMVREQ